MTTWSIAKNKPHDASGITNPNDYLWHQIKGIYYPNKMIDKRDWIHQLQPIVVEFLDGESKLVEEDVEWLIPILEAKIRYFNGLMSEAEYETILYNTER